MVSIHRGEIWWADFGIPAGSVPGYRRPVLIVQDDRFNKSRIATVIVAALTSNTAYAQIPGNVIVSAKESGLPKDSVVNVSQIAAIDREDLEECTGKLTAKKMQEVGAGIRMLMGL